MIKKAAAVIGAGFGDEGKGLMTDYLASRFGPPCTVVRFNGGAQAGHTVVTPDRQRHIFRHIGSGSFVGAATHLSKFFICNPVLFRKEHEELEAKIGPLKITIDPTAYVTTPYDMAINQMLEEMRGKHKHGSCGVGINETRQRQKWASLTVEDLKNKDHVLNTLKENRSESYIYTRIRNCILPGKTPDRYKFFFQAQSVIDNYLDDIAYFLDNVKLIEDKDIGSKLEYVVFEGAQGLFLDQLRREGKPYLTPSNTGLMNVSHLLALMPVKELEAVYVTRCYATRHGPGPMPREYKGKTKIPKDLTNTRNKYQGKLRFGPLNWHGMNKEIIADIFKWSGKYRLRVNMAVTCMDQLDEIEVITDKHQASEMWSMRAVKAAASRAYTSPYFSYGPTRNDVHATR